MYWLFSCSCFKLLSSLSKHLRNLSNICSVPELYLKCLLVCVWTDSCFYLLLFSQGNFFISVCICVCVHLCIVKLHFYPRSRVSTKLDQFKSNSLSVFFQITCISTKKTHVAGLLQIFRYISSPLSGARTESGDNLCCLAGLVSHPSSLGRCFLGA